MPLNEKGKTALHGGNNGYDRVSSRGHIHIAEKLMNSIFGTLSLVPRPASRYPFSTRTGPRGSPVMW